MIQINVLFTSQRIKFLLKITMIRLLKEKKKLFIYQTSFAFLCNGWLKRTNQDDPLMKHVMRCDVNFQNAVTFLA